jgi:hypothetical protein
VWHASGLIHDDDGVCTGGDGLADLRQMKVHRVDIAIQGGTGPAQVPRAGQIAPKICAHFVR